MPEPMARTWAGGGLNHCLAMVSTDQPSREPVIGLAMACW